MLTSCFPHKWNDLLDLRTTKLTRDLMRFGAAHRCRRRGRRPVSDVVGQLFDRLQGPALRRVSGAARNLPLLRQHLQLLADQLQQLLQHADGGVAAEGQHREVQRLHEGVRKTRRGITCCTSSFVLTERGRAHLFVTDRTTPISSDQTFQLVPHTNPELHDFYMTREEKLTFL